MKDEIKEILDKLKDTADTSFFAVCGSQEELDKMPKSITKILSISSKDAKILYNHITNLQERNEINIDRNIEAYKIVEQLEKRIEKAIEYINSRINTLNIISYEDIINILQGSDKDE